MSRPPSAVAVGPDPPADDQLDIILAAIEQSRASMESTISSMAQDFNILCDEHGKLKDRVKDTEMDIAEVQPSLATTIQDIKDFEERVCFLEG